MGLRDKIKGTSSAGSNSKGSALFTEFGITSNPFPVASQTQGHPHMETTADEAIERFVRQYNDTGASQVLVVEGDQGTGKTNLLNYYEREFRELYSETDGFYIIRYFSDPEPGFDKMLARILETLGTDYLKNIARALANTKDIDRAIDVAKLSDMRVVLRSLQSAADQSESALESTASAAMEWLLGFRLLKRHRDLLGSLHFRLDTVESKTQALRDLIYCSESIGVLRGLILLLDELEKTDDTKYKMSVLRFLSAIRALIDALPRFLFLMAAITPEARRRYFEMLPAFAGRLQNRIILPYLSDTDDALRLYHFYLQEAERDASFRTGKTPRNTRPVLTEEDARRAFSQLFRASQNRGDEGVRQRDYLNTLHVMAAKAIQRVESSQLDAEI